MGIEVKERKPETSPAGYEFVVHFRDGRDLVAHSAKLRKLGLKASITTLSEAQNTKMYVRFPVPTDTANQKPIHKEEVALRVGCRLEDVEEIYDVKEQPMRGEFRQRKVA